MQPQHHCVWLFLSVSWLARSFCELFSKHCCSSTTLTMREGRYNCLLIFNALTLLFLSHLKKEIFFLFGKLPELLFNTVTCLQTCEGISYVIIVVLQHIFLIPSCNKICVLQIISTEFVFITGCCEMIVVVPGLINVMQVI